MKNGRCRLHGGKSPGPPKGNQNALKHGYYTRDAIAQSNIPDSWLNVPGSCLTRHRELKEDLVREEVRGSNQNYGRELPLGIW